MLRIPLRRLGPRVSLPGDGKAAPHPPPTPRCVMTDREDGGTLSHSSSLSRTSWSLHSSQRAALMAEAATVSYVLLIAESPALSTGHCTLPSCESVHSLSCLTPAAADTQQDGRSGWDLRANFPGQDSPSPPLTCALTCPPRQLLHKLSGSKEAWGSKEMTGKAGGCREKSV